MLAVTFVSSKKLPKGWLKTMFCVRRCVVHDALLWLKANNVLYQDIVISEDRIGQLPLDDVPVELVAVMVQEEDESVATNEQESYVMAEGETTDGDGDVVMNKAELEGEYNCNVRSKLELTGDCKMSPLKEQ